MRIIVFQEINTSGVRDDKMKTIHVWFREFSNIFN